MRSKRTFAWIVVSIVCVALAACATTPQPTATPQVITKVETKVVEKVVEKAVMGKPIVIGAGEPLTGSDAHVYTVDCLVMKMAASEINAAGGVLGRPLEVVCLDDAGDPKQGAVIDQQFCDNADIVAAYGHGFSGVTIAGLPTLMECKIAEVTHATNPRLTSSSFTNVFQNVADDSLAGGAAADFLKDKGVKSVAVIHNKTMWGEGVATQFKDRAEKIGLTITSFQGFDPDAPDYSALLTRIKAENPDAIFTGMYAETARVRKQMLALGMSKVVFMGAELTNTEYMTSVGEDGVGVFTCTAGPDLNASEKTKAFVERCKKDFGWPPEPYAFYAYDGVYIIAEAIARAGSAEREAILKALPATNMGSKCMDYQYEFDSTGRVKQPRLFVYECKEPFKFVQVSAWVGEYPK